MTHTTDEDLVARIDRECSPLGRRLSMVDSKDIRALIADYRWVCELLRRAAPQSPIERFEQGTKEGTK